MIITISNQGYNINLQKEINSNALFINVCIDARLLKERILEKLQNSIFVCNFSTSFKGTVGIISSGPPFKEGRVRFTTVPFKPLSDHQRQRISNFSNAVFNNLKENIYFSGTSINWLQTRLSMDTNVLEEK